MALLPYFLSQISNSRHFLSLSFSRQYWSLSLFSPSPGRWIAPGWLYCSRLISLSPFPYCVPYFHIFHLPTMTRPVRYKALHFSLPASSLIFPLCQQQLPLLPLGAPSPPGVITIYRLELPIGLPLSLSLLWDSIRSHGQRGWQKGGCPLLGAPYVHKSLFWPAPRKASPLLLGVSIVEKCVG